MSDNQSNPFGLSLDILREANRMKEEGASNTQLRAYLEDHGVQVKFDTNDMGTNSGVEPVGDEEFRSRRETLLRDYDPTPSPISEEFAADIEHINRLQMEGTLPSPFDNPVLTNLALSNTDSGVIGPRGSASFMDKPFSAAIKNFAPTFDAAVARRHLYKDLLKRMNAEVDAGPLKGILFFHSVLRVPDSQLKGGIEFDFSMKGSDFRYYNRLKAFTGYLLQLRDKYLKEILDADAKVMERSDG